MRKYPLHMLIQCLMVKEVTRMTLVMKVLVRMMVTILLATQRKMRMKTPAIMEQNTTKILLKLRMDSSAFFCGTFCGTWDIP
jgi:hypothetical protein